MRRDQVGDGSAPHKGPRRRIAAIDKAPALGAAGATSGRDPTQTRQGARLLAELAYDGPQRAARSRCRPQGRGALGTADQLDHLAMPTALAYLPRKNS